MHAYLVNGAIRGLSTVCNVAFGGEDSIFNVLVFVQELNFYP